MPEAELAALLREAFVVTLRLAAPPLLAALAAGMVMSVVQAITQINEQTLSFVPKAAAVAAALLISGPFMAATLADFSRTLFDKLIEAGGW